MQNLRRIFRQILDLNKPRFLQIVILASLVMFGILSIIIEAVVSRSLEGLFLNLGTELIGAAVTYVLLSVVIDKAKDEEEKKKKEEEQNLKKKLKQQMANPSEQIAVSAVAQLREKGWLTDGTLREHSYTGADLRRANLSGADLQKVSLKEASLIGADLRECDLREADLTGANLQRANLYKVTLQDAELWDIDLSGANLRQANLRGAKLSKLDHLKKAESLQGAILPDGYQLPDDDSWREEFEKRIVEANMRGRIISAELDDDDDD